MQSLPNGMPVEVELIVEVDEEATDSASKDMERER
jgi:hypothetical protein